MKKRGPIVGGIGAGLIIISFLIALSVVPNTNPTMQGEMFLPNVLEGMFDEVTNEVQIFPQESNTFSFSTSKSDVPLLWSIQIMDYQGTEEVTVKVTNIFGDSFGNFKQEGPILFEMFLIPKNDIYNFEVINEGAESISVIMMFSEDPDNSAALSDPNSPLMSTLLPLAVSGIVMLGGIIIIIVGIIVTILDWKKGQNQSRYL